VGIEGNFYVNFLMGLACVVSPIKIRNFPAPSEAELKATRKASFFALSFFLFDIVAGIKNILLLK
jgi:hypothetical protein